MVQSLEEPLELSEELDELSLEELEELESHEDLERQSAEAPPPSNVPPRAGIGSSSRQVGT
ncbi:hypothetical protein [Noviherbaspirillum saxi]|uniref:hypothetical protein n=1 Tax=Noviherbaspirillum saxi TaxID=2320863 RepID=UPI001314B4BC|nr:hypothetical protein [Noviherbaspirillum saxi]